MMGIKEMIQDHKRRETRVALVGSDGVNKQDARRRALGNDEKAIGRDVQQRMKEYREGRVIDNLKRYKHPDNK